LRISKVQETLDISDVVISNSTFNYGKAIEIESAFNFTMKDSVFEFNKLENADFLVFNQLDLSNVYNLKFFFFHKFSEKTRFVIHLPTLRLHYNYSNPANLIKSSYVF